MREVRHMSTEEAVHPVLDIAEAHHPTAEAAGAVRDTRADHRREEDTAEAVHQEVTDVNNQRI